MGLEFEIIPAIDLKGGRCVQLQQGKRDAVLFSAENPVKIALHWLSLGVSRLHIIDLDAALQVGYDNFGIITEIVRQVKGRAKIQVGGGIRSYKAALRLLNLGVERIIFGTAMLKSPQLVRRIADEFSPRRVMIALDVRHGKVAIDGWREVTGIEAREAVKMASNIGAGSLLFTNIDVEGLMGGINIAIIKEILSYTTLPVVVSGGITSVEDIAQIEEAGASGVVIGSALYTGKLRLEEALRLRRRQDSNL